MPSSLPSLPHLLLACLLTVGVGWQRRCKTRHSSRKLGKRVSFFSSVPVIIEVDHTVLNGESELRAEGVIVLPDVCVVRHP